MQEAMPRSVKFIFLMYAVTLFGSALSALSIFVHIEDYFRDQSALSYALSLKTGGAMLCSMFLVRYLAYMRFSWALFFSQLLGLLALAFMYIGLSRHDLWLTLLGIFVSGIPMSFVSIIMTAYLRENLKGEAAFRRFSSYRNMILGITFVFVGALAPSFVARYGLRQVLLFDALSFVLALVCIYQGRFSAQAVDLSNASYTLGKARVRFSHVGAFCLSIIAVYWLSSWIPMIAGSSQKDVFSHIPSWFRMRFWVLEGVLILFASFIYSSLLARPSMRQNLSYILLINACCLLPLLIFANIFWVLAASMALGSAIHFGYFLIRDDFVLLAGKEKKMVRAYSSIATLAGHAMKTFSPLILGFLLLHMQLSGVVLVSCLVQVTALLGLCLLRKQA